jgi:hypothetical protein
MDTTLQWACNVKSLYKNIFVWREKLFSGRNYLCLNEMGGVCSTEGERRGVYRVVMGKPEGKRPLGRPRHRLEGNIQMDLQDASGAGTGLIWLRIGTGGVHL